MDNDEPEKVGDFWLFAPDAGCNEELSGWMVFDDDDGVPMNPVADFVSEHYARLFCACVRAQQSATLTMSA